MMICSQIITQKVSVYKQYYNHFKKPIKLQSIYNNKVAVSDIKREALRAKFLKRRYKITRRG